MIKDLWYQVVGDEEKTIVQAPYKKCVDDSLDTIADECAKHLHFLSKRWNKFDFTMYPLNINFGFIDEVDNYGEYEATIEAEFEVDSTTVYLYVSDCGARGMTELINKYADRAREAGLVWVDEAGGFVDEFYLEMSHGAGYFGEPAYLSDGVYIEPCCYGLDEIEEELLSRENDI
tara:strand:- start:1845 stop:2369 length:525 start_codon:yes stop_codon:yes gene_type:complete